MNVRICAAFVLISMSGPAFAADEARPPSPPGNTLQYKGAPEDQAACGPDSNKFCKDAIPDTFRVLACLEENRDKLRKARQKVLEDNGQ